MKSAVINLSYYYELPPYYDSGQAGLYVAVGVIVSSPPLWERIGRTVYGFEFPSSLAEWAGRFFCGRKCSLPTQESNQEVWVFLSHIRSDQASLYMGVMWMFPFELPGRFVSGF